MSDRMMTEFDADLRARVVAYADDALGAFDSTVIAREAIGRSARLTFAVPRWSRRRSRTIVLVAAAVTVALLVASMAGGPRPSALGDAFSSPVFITWSPDGSKLAFLLDVGDRETPVTTTGERTAHDELWVVAADGSGRSRIVRFPANGMIHQPMWSPDSVHLAYELPHDDSPGAGSGSAIAVVGLDGEPARVIADGPDEVGLVGWSPAGDRILYDRTDAAGSDIYMTSIDGAQVEQLTTSHEAYAYPDAWSPDGARILYVDGLINGTQTAHSGSWVMRADGSAKARLGPCCDVGWSADGAKVYFEAGTGPLLSAAADGSDVQPLVENHAPFGWVLSPDGSRYATATSGGIEVARLGEAPVQLTTEPTDASPAWSADGSRVVFWGSRPEGTGLFVIAGDGGHPTLVGADAELGAWQPTRTGTGRLAFLRDRAILTVNADGSDLRQLVSRTTIAGAPRVPTTGDSAFQSTMILGPNGPDRDIYRISLRPNLVFTFDNRTDVAWVVDLPGFDILRSDCLVGPSGSVTLVTYQKSPRPAGTAFDTPPDNCSVFPHSTVSINKPESPGGPAAVLVLRADGKATTGYPVIFDLERGQ